MHTYILHNGKGQTVISCEVAKSVGFNAIVVKEMRIESPNFGKPCCSACHEPINLI